MHPLLHIIRYGPSLCFGRAAPGSMARDAGMHRRKTGPFCSSDGMPRVLHLLCGLFILFVTGTVGTAGCDFHDYVSPGERFEQKDLRHLKNSDIRSSWKLTKASPTLEKPVDAPRWSRRYDPQFRKYSKRFFGVGFDWRWFKSQAIAESELKHTSIGPMGARGVMQLMPETFSRANNEMFLMNHQQRWHIAVGIQYNRWLWNRWKAVLEPEQRIPFMLASYNCGRGRLLRATYMCGGCLKWNRVQHFAPPITRHYLVKVFSSMGRAPR